MESSQPPVLIDVHTHVQFRAFEPDADAVVRRALAAGIWMVNVGTQRDTSARAVALAHRYSEGVYATVGLHPIHTERSHHDPQELGAPAGEELGESGTFTSRGEEFDYEYYWQCAADPKVVAIGECGLDYYRAERGQGKAESTKQKQRGAFLAQIELAHEMKKPLMIHCRRAFGDLVQMLDSKSQILNSPAGVVHFFSGTWEDAKKLLDLGFSFSFGGVVTFARDYDEVVTKAPLDRLLLETDAPYVAPVPYRGKRNEPAYIVETVKKLAELRGISTTDVVGETTAHARRLFRV